MLGATIPLGRIGGELVFGEGLQGAGGGAATALLVAGGQAAQVPAAGEPDGHRGGSVRVPAGDAEAHSGGRAVPRGVVPSEPARGKPVPSRLLLRGRAARRGGRAGVRGRRPGVDDGTGSPDRGNQHLQARPGSAPPRISRSAPAPGLVRTESAAVGIPRASLPRGDPGRPDRHGDDAGRAARRPAAPRRPGRPHGSRGGGNPRFLDILSPATGGSRNRRSTPCGTPRASG